MIIPLTPEAELNSRPTGSLQEGSTGVTRQEGSFDTVLRSGTSVPVTDEIARRAIETGFASLTGDSGRA
jgi:hypothetical protein